MKTGHSDSLEFDFYEPGVRPPMFLHENLATLSDDDGPIVLIDRVLPTQHILIKHLRHDWTAIISLQEIAERIIDCRTVKESVAKSSKDGG